MWWNMFHIKHCKNTLSTSLLANHIWFLFQRRYAIWGFTMIKTIKTCNVDGVIFYDSYEEKNPCHLVFVSLHTKHAHLRQHFGPRVQHNSCWPRLNKCMILTGKWDDGPLVEMVTTLWEKGKWLPWAVLRETPKLCTVSHQVLRNEDPSLFNDPNGVKFQLEISLFLRWFKRITFHGLKLLI